MKRSIILILILMSFLGYSQQPFYGDRKFVSYDGIDTLYLTFKGDSTLWLSTDSLYYDAEYIQWLNSLSWNDTTLNLSALTGNIFIGKQVGESVTSGFFNTYIGEQSGVSTTSGSENVFIGELSGYSNTSGGSNVFLGIESGYSITTGDRNVLIGAVAGSSLTTGTGNIFIGSLAGSNETGDSLLYIEDTDTSSPLIWGDFANDSIKFNAKTSSDYFIGQLYDKGDSTLSVPATGTYYTFGKWLESTAENTTLTDSTITVASNGNGYYSINTSFSFTHSSNLVTVHFSVFVNDVEREEIECERKIGTGGDIGNAANSGVLWLDNSDVVKVKFRADKTGTITINHGNFNIKRIN